MTNPILTSKSFKGNDSEHASQELVRVRVYGRGRGRGHGRVTLVDVAAQAGVTTMTVSRYLRSPERVAAGTAEKVAHALEVTGYSPNLQAGSLASGRSHSVAVIVPNIAHSIFADTLHGLGAGLQSQGLHMLVSSTGYSLAQEEQQVRTVLGWAPAAVVVTGRAHLPRTLELLNAAQKRGTPVVEIWDQSPAGEPHSFHQIGFNHTQVGAAMAQALMLRGYERLAFMDVGIDEDFRAHERAQGFIRQAQAGGIEAQLLSANSGDPVEQGGVCFAAWHARQGVAERQRAWGIGFANDLLATGSLLQAHTLSYRMPQDLALLGFGDFLAARYCLGGLSTMTIDGEQIGQACASYLVQQLQQDPTLTGYQRIGQEVLHPRLLWRGCETK